MNKMTPPAPKRRARKESAKAPPTIAAANGIAADKAFGAVTPPIYLSITFAFAGLEQSGPYEYTRAANPSRDLLADTISKLEQGAVCKCLQSRRGLRRRMLNSCLF